MIDRHTFFKTLKWFALIVFLAGAAAGGYGYWLWQHCDEYLLQLIVQKQQELVPDWDVEIGRAHFDWHRRVHIYDVTIKAKGQTETVLTLPEVVIAIDREKFERQQEFDVQSVRIKNPTAKLRRDAKGIWNWQALLTLKPSKRSLPEWTIEKGMLQLVYEQAGNASPTEIVLTQAEGKLIPSGKRQFKILGQAEFNDSGNVAVEGDWFVDARQWQVKGQLTGIQKSGELIKVAAGTSQVLRQKLAALGESLEQTRVALEEAEETRTALREESRFPQAIPKRTPSGTIPDFGLESHVDLNFQVTQTAPGKEWDFRILLDLEQGTLSHPVLPFPLRGLAGEVYWDNRRMEFRKLTAQNGTTRLLLDGHLNRGEPHATGRLKMEVTDLLLEQRLRSRLPHSFREPYDNVQPSGPADVVVVFERETGRPWKPREFLLTAKGLGAVNRKFPYPVTDITGTMQLVGDDLVIAMTGQAGGRRVEIAGRVNHPGPLAETWFVIRGDHFPLDDRFKQACSPEAQSVLDQMNLSGWADVYLSLYRPPGPQEEFVTKIEARLSNCEIYLDAFPYRVTKLGGVVTYESDRQLWKFEKLAGEHGTAKLSAVGNYQQAVAPGVLEMKITTEGAAFDESLYRALPEGAKTVWNNFSPSGKLDTVAKIRWVPDLGFEWSLPDAEIYDARMTLKSFPYALTGVRANVSYDAELCKIKSFSAKHGDTQIRGRGEAFLPSEGRWVCELLELYVDDLSPDRQFRQALPSGVRTVVEELDPQHPFSFSGAIRLEGTERETDPVLASWNLGFVFTGNQLNTGIKLNNVLGRVSARGHWNGKTAENAGRIDLESLEVLDYQLTKVQGPYRIEGDKVTIGSAKAFDPNRDQVVIPPAERLTARAIGGVLTYDAEVFLEKDVRYRSRLNLIDGKLEEYARRYLPGTKNLYGVINGRLDLAGQGVSTNHMTGSGQLRVSPAALYELPILARVWQVLTLAGPDKTAFRFASVDFDIAKNQFVFNAIDLVGDSLILRGYGTAGFDGGLKIEFFSRMPKVRLPKPVANLVNPVLDEATKDWVRVDVRGKTSRPDVRLEPWPLIDDTIKRFLGILGSGVPTELKPFPVGRNR